MRRTILLIAACCLLASCQKERLGPTQLNSTAQSSNRVERVIVWSCSMHPQVQRVDEGKCPICMMDILKTELILTYGPATRFFCPEHGGGFEKKGKCQQCGKELEPFQTEALLNKERRTVNE